LLALAALGLAAASNAGVIRYGFGPATNFPRGVRGRWAAT
jgi:hypothetical protein